jgi:hypothetical protein
VPGALRALLNRLFGGASPGVPGVAQERLSVRGFNVLVKNTRPDIATPDVIERLDEALGLIERTQPWRFRHLQRDLRAIWVVRYPTRGAYFPADRACLTELTFLARRDITAATVASSIMHEGMHARVDCCGVHPASRDMAREERLCRRAELAFGQALPASLGAPVIERAIESLALADAEVAPDIDWEVAHRRQAMIDAAAAGRDDRPRPLRGEG